MNAVDVKNMLDQAANQMDRDIQSAHTLLESTNNVIGVIADRVKSLQAHTPKMESILIDLTFKDSYVQENPETEPVISLEMSEVSLAGRKTVVLARKMDVTESEGNVQKRRKLVSERSDHLTEDESISRICCTDSVTNGTTKLTPSPLASSNTSNHNLNLVDESIDTAVARLALQRCKSSVLSDEDFLSFIYIGGRSQDPVGLARIAFTADINGLHKQLKVFSSHLSQVMKDTERPEGPSASNCLQQRIVLRLLHIFHKQLISETELNS